MLNIIKLLSKRQHVDGKHKVLNSHCYLHCLFSINRAHKTFENNQFLIGKQGYLNQPSSHTVVNRTWCHVINGGSLEIRFYTVEKCSEEM